MNWLVTFLRKGYISSAEYGMIFPITTDSVIVKSRREAAEISMVVSIRLCDSPVEATVCEQETGGTSGDNINIFVDAADLTDN
jgi:hypothetical protein